MTTPKFTSFTGQILYFNNLYKLPVAPIPSVAVQETYLPVDTRIKDFMGILSDEISEGTDIINKIKAGAEEMEVLTDLADWFCDIIVYCASEAARYGIPVNEVLSIIMESNFSKLDADGRPIYNELGKVMKGPNYWKPEPRIKELLLSFKFPTSGNQSFPGNEWTSK